MPMIHWPEWTDPRDGVPRRVRGMIRSTSGPVAVILVEPDPTLAIQYSNELRSAGFEPDCGATAADALGSLRSQLPDVVIISVGLPDEAALGFLTSLRTDARLGSVAVAMIASLPPHRHRVKSALEMGADDVIRLPLEALE